MDSNVFVVVLYDGAWAVEGFNWIFNNPKSKMLMFEVDTTLEKMNDILYEELDIDPIVYKLKIEVCYMYMKGNMIPPEVLVKDSQVRLFLRMKAKMSVENLLPLFVTKVKRHALLGPTPPTVLPRSVVGSFVPETDPAVGMNEQAPTNIDEDNRVDYEFDQFNEFDGAFYNNDPIVDLNEDGDAELEVHEPMREDIEENNVYTTSLTGTHSGEIYVGKLYTNKTELKNVVGRFALKMNFEFMVKKSGTDVFYATCRGSDCKWRVRGRKRARCDMFEVTVFHNEHTCSLDCRHPDNRQAVPWVVGHLIKNKFKSDGTKYKAKDIQRDMFQEYGIKMSYEKKNPGTITDIITEDNRFKYCFWSLAACRRGFKFCRPVISIDGTFLKTRFGGTMLVAVAYDANNQLFPIAFAIVDSENHDSWKYFLQKLKEAIGEVENLVFVSDRHQSIEHVVEVIFPEACHCACYKHISMNVTHKFKTDVCNTQIWLAAYAWSKRECDRHLQVLRQMDPHIAAYVDNIGLEKWARPYCLGDRYNIMTNNAAESLNNVTEEFRAYPITTLVEFIRFTLQNWFANRLEKASKCVTPLATHFEEDLIKQHEDGRRRSVLRNGA
ncbi:uncharacterized protein LOC133033758 [Cannabis sativa]|uniref:uncharacterized protein LOC133033758 n=1 Tax=Cannabis sativa TaxID=3483 RepID=UPI0029CA88D8|nr:uncharacterized protein LOC133033758 [Cannabis sativa]